MTTMQAIEEKTRVYADARDLLAARVQMLQEQIEQAKRAALPAIRKAVQAATEARDRLEADLQAAPELFKRPRTQTFAGVRVGYTKQKGKVAIADEDATIARIRKHLPDDQAELLIRVKESVDKTAVYNLEARDLKRLGITITDDTDAVVIKATDTEVDKLVNALLMDSEQVEAEAAA